MKMQFRLHLAALALLLGALAWPPLLYPGALAFIASCVWLEWNLITATRAFARFSRELAERSVREQAPSH